MPKKCPRQNNLLSALSVEDYVRPFPNLELVPMLLGDTLYGLAVVQSAGHVYRFKGQPLKDEFYRAGPMQRSLLRYT